MKRNLTLLFLMLAFAGYSQGKLTYGSGGTVYNAENQKVKTDLVRALMNENPEALALYNSGRNKKTWGNIFFYGGLALVATNLIVEMNEGDMPDNWNGYGPAPVKRSNMTMAIIGGAMLVASIPIKIGYPKKIKAALEKYNKGLAENYSPGPKTTLIASTNQIGLRIEF
ncbi:hypothetical protein RB619_11115 [Flavobacterium sp. LHD-80]|uniref:hypothetical protein n=1 Tax=Flavobacterium sp. LHD-80 TaxID=3071411 RepID=UPI0027E136BA|nr:hypothetical protein [Flavobacterium sp. LHD-80]MDQ6471193.1 hypothetical protein [Flavobacterium sp. LHD-80]